VIGDRVVAVDGLPVVDAAGVELVVEVPGL
jgi:hypothetical protein